ncbi:hypothetical protein ACIQUQ_33460 [Streptomyces sp. NPDC101118]|uniref:hypothetical protein n=1 Tax=Streptomyces sp. NPDC101118 TaxID=3366109 RepID=UPI0037FB931C
MTTAPDRSLPDRSAPSDDAPSPAYWAAAEAAGLVVRRGGHRVVAGTSTDPLTGLRGVLVEYADPGALTDGTLESVLADLDAPVAPATPDPRRAATGPGASAATGTAGTTCGTGGAGATQTPGDPHASDVPDVREATTADGFPAHPGACRVQVRTPADTVLPPPWRRSVTYIRRTGPLPDAPRPAGLRIVPADDALLPAVRDWMARAVRQGAAEQGLPAPHGAVAEAVDAVLGEPGLALLVGLLDDRPVGHAVLLTGARDAVTDRPSAELWDVLVEPATPRAADCRDALVGAAADRAAGLRLPLLGHVVHRAEETASRALTSLLARGWHTDHAYWTAPVDHRPPTAGPRSGTAAAPAARSTPTTSPTSNGTPR